MSHSLQVHYLRRTTNGVPSRNSSNYSMGFGWTGALGTGSLATNQRASSSSSPSSNKEDDDTNKDEHNTNEYEDEDPLLEWEDQSDAHFNHSGLLPILPNTDVISIACGWGHTAIIVKDAKKHTQRPMLLLCGRPHDFQSLLRLQRLPTFVTDVAVRLALYLDQVDQEKEQKFLPSFLQNHDNPISSSSSEESSGKRQMGILPHFTPMALPNDDVPIDVVASAGLSLILGTSGTLYSLGLNNQGQAGLGKISNNVWIPSPVQMELSSTDDAIHFQPLEAFIPPTPSSSSSSIHRQTSRTMALGLQHALAIDPNGKLYTWGKGDRGQLGHSVYESSSIAKHVVAFQTSSTQYIRVTHVAAGFNHSVCVTEENQAWIWGKNIAFSPHDAAESNNIDYEDSKKKIIDSPIPMLIKGLPSSLQIIDICCGSHHTSILLEDGSVYAMGIATDNHQPVFDEAVPIIPPTPAFAEGKVRQFTAAFDRTTIISNDGRTMREVQLWSNDELREDAAVIPSCVQSLHLEPRTKDHVKIQMLERGWKHSLLIVE